jgi:hypothetical protein
MKGTGVSGLSRFRWSPLTPPNPLNPLNPLLPASYEYF